MAPYMMIMIGMVLLWDVTKCVARPADTDKWAGDFNFGRRSEDDEVNAIDTEPSGLYGGKAAVGSGWKAVFRLAEIVRLSKKFEQALGNEVDDIAANSAPNPVEDSGPNPVEGSVPNPVEDSVPNPAQGSALRNPPPPIYGPERIIDQLHEQTGEKQPVYHTALDGWIF